MERRRGVLAFRSSEMYCRFGEELVLEILALQFHGDWISCLCADWEELFMLWTLFHKRLH